VRLVGMFVGTKRAKDKKWRKKKEKQNPQTLCKLHLFGQAHEARLGSRSRLLGSLTILHISFFFKIIFFHAFLETSWLI
jgi:hypothetical protein